MAKEVERLEVITQSNKIMNDEYKKANEELKRLEDE